MVQYPRFLGTVFDDEISKIVSAATVDCGGCLVAFVAHNPR